MRDNSTSLLDALFQGAFAPVESMTYNNPEYDKASEVFSQSEKELINTLNDEQRELYDTAYGKLMSQQTALINRAFAMGVKYCIDIMEELKNIPPASKELLEAFLKDNN